MSEGDSNPPKSPGARSRRSAAPSGPAASAAGGKPSDPSLGAFLTTTREGRGVTRDDVVKETRIPAHYIGMIESDNYSAISDQLYVLPFIRRYATFLGLDSDEIAVRFVRAVQHSETSVVRMSEPIVERRRRRGHMRVWVLTAVALAMIAAVLYLRSRRVSASFRPEPATVEPSPGVAGGEKPGVPIVVAPPAAPAAPSGTNPAPPQRPISDRARMRTVAPR